MISHAFFLNCGRNLQNPGRTNVDRERTRTQLHVISEPKRRCQKFRGDRSPPHPAKPHIWCHRSDFFGEGLVFFFLEHNDNSKVVSDFQILFWTSISPLHFAKPFTTMQLHGWCALLVLYGAVLQNVSAPTTASGWIHLLDSLQLKWTHAAWGLDWLAHFSNVSFLCYPVLPQKILGEGHWHHMTMPKFPSKFYLFRSTLYFFFIITFFFFFRVMGLSCL